MRRIIVLASAGAVVALLIVAQLVLPGIAEQQLRDRLARSGTVRRVEVDAFPAIELLWHHADRVVVRLARYQSRPGPLGDLLKDASDVGSLDASVARLDTGLLTLRDATVRKHGQTLTAIARITEGDLRSAVPFLDAVQPVASGSGQLTLRGTATLFGVTATVDATLAVVDGNLVVQPDVPLGGLATVTVFSNPHLEVRGVSVSESPGGFSVSATGRMR